MTTTTIAAVTQRYKKRDITSAVSHPPCMHNHGVEKRQATSSTLSTPSPLATVPSTILSSACSLEATPISKTSTIYTTTTTTTYAQTTSTSVITAGTSTTTAYTTVTSTTTISIASAAPSGQISYLRVNPVINSGGIYCLSDPATHMSDNYRNTTLRETFVVTSKGQLYSVTHNSYYYPKSGLLYYSSTASDGSTAFTAGAAASDGSQLVTLAGYKTCVYTVASSNGDANTNGNAATGMHIGIYATGATIPNGCSSSNLYLVPS